jgi:signal peptidase II
MYLGQSFEVLGDFFRITFVENPGMAFGIRVNNTTVFLGLSLLAAVLVFYYLFKLRKEGWFLQLALIFITAGAIGNLTDRFIYGKVVDFLDFEFFDISIPAFELVGINFSGYSMTRWPVFNVADMAVTGGMTILILFILLYGDPLKKSIKLEMPEKNE